MKVNLKMDPETLFLLHKVVLEECQMMANGRQMRSGKSMRVELFEIVARRCIAYSANPNGKSIGLTLKFHLANLVYDILEDMRFTYGGIYEANKLDMLKNQLHQKLI